MGKAHAYETLRTLAVHTPTAAGVDGDVEGWTGTLPVGASFDCLAPFFVAAAKNVNNSDKQIA